MNQFLLAALLSVPAFAGPRNPDTFVTLLRNPWETLDPAVAYDLGSYFVLANAYEALLAFDGGPAKLAPLLSTEVPSAENKLISPDGRVYRFPIRRGVKFHDGSTLTPEDVRYSLLREIVTEESDGSSSALLRPLIGADSVLDSKGRWSVDNAKLERALRVEGDSVVFELEKPIPGFLQMVASWPVVMPKKWALEQGDWDGALPAAGSPAPKTSPKLKTSACGTGPFRVVRAAEDGSDALLERFDKYWGPKAVLKQACFHAEPNDAIRAALLEDGEADYAYLERPSLGLLRMDKGIVVAESNAPMSSGETLFLTQAIDPKDNRRLGSAKLDGKGIPPDFFADKDVRAAFAYAFDPETYLTTALSGKGRRAAGPIPEALAALDLDNPYRHDSALATEAMKRAWGGKVWKHGFKLTIGYPRGSLRRQIACELLKKGVEALQPSFHVEIEALAPVEFEKEYRAHRIPVFVHSVAPDYADPRAVATQFFHSSGYFARAQALRDDELDLMETAAGSERDPEQRRVLYASLIRRALDQSYQIYTYSPLPFKALRSWVKDADKRQGVNGLGFANLLYIAPLGKR